ncbi:hypothetical protein AX17_004710 [Amanita inopinata Kibby_2008]|nr:hypothetical protein AX17_004710 [Amanita inopinata Kibby_2008]
MVNTELGVALNPEDSKRHEALQLINSDVPATWEAAWKVNITPWDLGRVHPTLREAVEESGIEFPNGSDKKALVPGCGSGYDVPYLASKLGLHATGIDIAPTALERASKLAKADSSAPQDRIEYKLQDFFTLSPRTDADKYDLVYDYTFFVAIPPSRRLEWGQQMAALVKPGGYLICVPFPIEPKKDVGPPWFVRPDHYDEPLGGPFKKVLDKVPEKLPPILVGKQHLLIWQRI